jgi:hypothetical protein
MILFDRFDADARLDTIEPHQCSWLIACRSCMPLLWKVGGRDPAPADAPRFCLVAGDVCPLELQQDFASMFGARLRPFWDSTVRGRVELGLFAILLDLPLHTSCTHRLLLAHASRTGVSTVYP